jgi:hypothetical protein
MKPQVISPKFIYPKQTMKKDYLYRVYGKVEDNWMIVGKALLCFSVVNFSDLDFISSLFSNNNFNISIIVKNFWQFFYTWLDMAKWRKGAWSG